MNWFRKLMYGRYGSDHLNFALIIIGFLISFIGNLTHLFLLSVISYLIIIWAFFRMFSKNTAKRYKENLLFLSKCNPIKLKIQGIIQRIKASKTYRFYKCKNCKQKMRVPKGRGKINITCPKCKTTFAKKT